MNERPRRRLPYLTLAIVSASVALELVPRAAAAARFEREALQSGELWRFFSGHLFHGSWSLAWVDLLVLAVLGTWWELRSRAMLAGILVASAALASTAVLACTSLERYVGSSALSSGLFVATALSLALEGRGRRRGLFSGLLVLFGLKVALELFGLSIGLVALPPGTAVVATAHLAGGMAGALVVGVSRFRRA